MNFIENYSEILKIVEEKTGHFLIKTQESESTIDSMYYTKIHCNNCKEDFYLDLGTQYANYDKYNNISYRYLSVKEDFQKLSCAEIIIKSIIE